jgi:hypothetical protein
VSALPPETNFSQREPLVRFVPEADIILLDHFVRPGKYCRQIDSKFVPVWCLQRQAGRLFAFEDTIDIAGRFPKLVDKIGLVEDQAATGGKNPSVVHTSQANDVAPQAPPLPLLLVNIVIDEALSCLLGKMPCSAGSCVKLQKRRFRNEMAALGSSQCTER